jgi:glycosyltransferase involved in cell wall biosynthesis
MNRIKILFCDQPLEPPGGGQMSLKLILEHLDPNRYDVTVYLSRAGSYYDLLKDLGVNVDVVVHHRLLGAIHQLRPQIIHCNSATTRYSFVVALVSRVLRIPMVWHIRVLDDGGWKERLIASMADSIVAISSAVAERMRQRAAVHKVKVIPNAVDLPAIDQIERYDRRQLNIDHDLFIVGVFSRVVPWKGHPLFMRALKRLIQSGLPVCGLVVGAGDSGDVHALQRIIEDLDLSQHVHVLGHRNDVFALMKMCDAVVNPSIEPEPFGRVIIEAMACQKCVLATNQGGPVDIIDHRINGLLVETNELALAEGLRDMIGDTRLRDQIAAQAYEHVSKTYAISRQINCLDDLWGRLTGCLQDKSR